MRILIVDDDPNGRYMLEALLKGDGHEVVTAENGEDALKSARANPPDMIISDILMPVMDGFQLCRNCKRDDVLKAIPFVFYTATYTDEKDEELAYKLGADGFIRKPMEPDEFRRLIRGALSESKRAGVGPNGLAPEEEEDLCKLYSERLVNKLERKVFELESALAELRDAQEEVKRSLEEKEVLLYEIHHRVKNNLEVISSLIDLRAMRANNQETSDSLKDIDSKIHTMALIHTQLHQEGRIDQINMPNHIQELLGCLPQIYAPEGVTITPAIHGSEVYLSLTQAIPCALILNELVTNAYRHAFKEGQGGRIEISLKRADNTIILEVKDDGIGMPEEIDIYEPDTLGLKLVKNTVQDQLKGEISIERGAGTTITVKFQIMEPEGKNAERDIDSRR